MDPATAPSSSWAPRRGEYGGHKFSQIASLAFCPPAPGAWDRKLGCRGHERRRLTGPLGHAGCRRACGLQAAQEMRAYYVPGTVLHLGNLRMN